MCIEIMCARVCCVCYACVCVSLYYLWCEKVVSSESGG